MLLKGIDIQNPNELLTEYSISQLWDDLKGTDGNHSRDIQHYRILKRSFSDQANEIQKSLPYFTFCQLSPRKHKTGRFVKIESFCVDVRNFPREMSLLKEWRSNLQNDRRIEMMFLSADGNTMHILFRFRIPCRDEKKFRLFYRNFTLLFYKENNINEDVLSEACDPRRAITISWDPEAFYRIGARLVIFEDYIYNEWTFNKNDKRKKVKLEHTVTDENIATIKKIIEKKTHDKAYRLSINEITNRIDANRKRLESDLGKQHIALHLIECQHGNISFSIKFKSSSLKYNLIIDNKGNHVLLPLLSQAGSVISKKAEEIINHFLKQIL